MRVRVGGDPSGDRGLTSVEYALMVAVVVILLVGGLVPMLNAVRERFDRNTSCAATAYRGQGC
jgi:Flp pilus assembly pilin Flp